MKNFRKIMAAAITAALMATTFAFPAFASWEDEPDYSVTGDFPELVNVVIYGGADSEGLGDEYAAQYADIIGDAKKLVVRIEEKLLFNSDPMNEDVVYSELSELDCKTTFTIDSESSDCGVYFFNDNTKTFSKMDATYADGKYTFEVETVYPGLLFLSEYELSDDETISQQTLEDSETGVKAEGKFMNGTFMDTYSYNEDYSGYKVVFGRNFNALDNVDAKLYLPCKNSEAKAGFMAYDDEMKFVDFGAEYTDGYLVIDTKDIPTYELNDIFVGTDKEIDEYIKSSNSEGDDNESENSQESSADESKTEILKTESKDKSSVNTGDNSNVAVIMIIVLAAACAVILVPTVKKSK